MKKEHVNQLELITSNLASLSEKLPSDEQDKHKAHCDFLIKIFEHEKQKTQKLEDKAYKVVTFLIAVSTAYSALIIWFIQTTHKGLSAFNIQLMIFILILGAFYLLASINKAFDVMWTRPELNPASDLEVYHRVANSDVKCLDVYKHYGQIFAKICDKRLEGNQERGRLLEKALLWAKKAVLTCLIIGIATLILSNPILG